MDPQTKELIENSINANEVCLFMKGTPDAPQCGFSMATSNILKHLNVAFKGINVLEDDNLRQGIKDFTNWPTIPQLYVKGEFIGGCDIIKEMYENGELKTKTGYQGGAKDGEYISWFDNGKQKEEGLWDEGEFLLRNRWSKNGSILLENGNGSWVGRNANGLEVWKRLYVDGILSKEWDYEYEYHGNGQLMSSKRFNKSINDGQFTTWYESGEKRSEDNWENGKKVGKWFSWHSNGQVESEGFYIDDQKDGLWVFYDETGAKVSEGVYAAGALINNNSLE